MNALEDKSIRSKFHFVGDVDFDTAIKKVSYITPVPGGAGPLTIAMLVENIYLAWNRQQI